MKAYQGERGQSSERYGEWAVALHDARARWRRAEVRSVVACSEHYHVAVTSRMSKREVLIRRVVSGSDTATRSERPKTNQAALPQRALGATKKQKNQLYLRGTRVALCWLS